MYALGLEARFDQMEYCISRLNGLTAISESTTATADAGLDSNRQAEFYCDTFWTWAYSSLDILAQVINQTENLRIKENKVSFDDVLAKLKSMSPVPPTLGEMKALERSYGRSWMKAYRNCANHRRPICLFHETKTESVTKAYESATEPISRTIRYIVYHNVPYEPKKKDRKELIPLCKNARDSVNTKIAAVLRKLLR